MNDEDRHKIACHEAAHALTAYLLRIPIDEVCKGTDGSGYMSDDGPAPSLDEGRSPFDVGYAHAVVAAAPIAAYAAKAGRGRTPTWPMPVMRSTDTSPKWAWQNPGGSDESFFA